MSCNRKKLVALMFDANNNRFTTVLRVNDPRVKEAGVVINTKDGNWTTPISEGSASTETYMIGQARPVNRANRQGVIGVYARNKTTHLQEMVSDGQDAVN